MQQIQVQRQGEQRPQSQQRTQIPQVTRNQPFYILQRNKNKENYKAVLIELIREIDRLSQDPRLTLTIDQDKLKQLQSLYAEFLRHQQQQKEEITSYQILRSKSWTKEIQRI